MDLTWEDNEMKPATYTYAPNLITEFSWYANIGATNRILDLRNLNEKVEYGGQKFSSNW